MLIKNKIVVVPAPMIILIFFVSGTAKAPFVHSRCLVSSGQRRVSSFTRRAIQTGRPCKNVPNLWCSVDFCSWSKRSCYYFAVTLFVVRPSPYAAHSGQQTWGEPCRWARTSCHCVGFLAHHVFGVQGSLCSARARQSFARFFARPASPPGWYNSRWVFSLSSKLDQIFP